MSEKEEMISEGNLNVTLTLRLLMHGKVIDRYGNSSNNLIYLCHNILMVCNSIQILLTLLHLASHV